MKTPQVNFCPFTSQTPPSSPPPPISAISGVRNELVKDATSAVNAVPMTTATANSTTLPRSRKSLNPLSMGVIQLLSALLATSGHVRLACHGRDSVTVSVDV